MFNREVNKRKRKRERRSRANALDDHILPFRGCPDFAKTLSFSFRELLSHGNAQLFFKK